VSSNKGTGGFTPLGPDLKNGVRKRVFPGKFFPSNFKGGFPKRVALNVERIEEILAQWGDKLKASQRRANITESSFFKGGF